MIHFIVKFYKKVKTFNILPNSGKIYTKYTSFF